MSREDDLIEVRINDNSTDVLYSQPACISYLDIHVKGCALGRMVRIIRPNPFQGRWDLKIMGGDRSLREHRIVLVEKGA